MYDGEHAGVGSYSLKRHSLQDFGCGIGVVLVLVLEEEGRAIPPTLWYMCIQNNIQEHKSYLFT